MTDAQKKWMAMLAKLVQPADPVGAGKAMADMAYLLQYPDGAFTLASLEFVAKKVRRLPNYAELNDALLEWWNEHKPPAPTLTITHDRSMEASQARSDEARLRAQQDWADPAKIRQSLAGIGKDHPMREAMGKALGSLVRRHAPDNLNVIPPEWHPE